jgi:hypothetical protein
MTANYHTPITTGAVANAATFNSPMGEMDAALTTLQDRINNVGNYAINSGFDLAQRQVPATLTEIADKDYGPDQWWISSAAGGVQYQRVETDPADGLSSKYYGVFSKSTSTGKMFICQPIEGRETIPLRGRAVIFQMKMAASAGMAVRMAVLELQSAGTLDAPPATLVTNFGANGVLPTFGANVAIITASAVKTVTTSFQSFSVSVTVPSDSKNLFLAVWSDSGMVAEDSLVLAEADLFPGVSERTWVPNPISQEIVSCQRYYWKTYEIDTEPAYDSGKNIYENSRGAIFGIAGKAGETVNAAVLYVRLPVDMFSVPAVTIKNPSKNNNQVFDFIHGGDCSSSLAFDSYVSSSSIVVFATGNASTTVGDTVGTHLVAIARIL